MLTHQFRWLGILLLALTSTLTLCVGGCDAVTPAQQHGAPEQFVHWESPARLRHRITSTSGILVLDQQGVHFRTAQGAELSWPFAEIQGFYITPNRLELESYENRGWHFPGVKHLRFDLGLAVPPPVAAALAMKVGKPSRNGVPDPRAPSFASLTARHVSRFGGSNGTLRLTADGIDYVTVSGPGSRIWRWADIQTLAHPDPYHFTVGGYRETFDFDLKRPMSQALFDRLWDFVYGRGLQLSIASP